MERIDLDNKTLLVTGAAGFIGANLVKKLLSYVPTANIIGIDSVNDYYDVKLKEYRLKELSRYTGFDFIKGNIADKNLMNSLFEKYRPSVVVNLAAQAGVRYSIENPDAYMYMHQAHQSMAPTKKCLTVRRIKWIILFRCMPLPKSPMS